MTIKFDTKFTQANFETIIAKYWNKVKYSSDNEPIVFDLSNVEWIALEEITFLFGWFRYLILQNHKINILLPKLSDDRKRSNLLKSLWIKWRIYSFYYSLLNQSGNITDYFNVDTSLNKLINEQVEREKFDHDNPDEAIAIVPFQVVKLAGYGQSSDLDRYLSDKIYGPTNIENILLQVFEKYANLPTKENILISKVISNELFLNVIHHAFEKRSNTDECYFAISFKRKLTDENIYKTNYFSQIDKFDPYVKNSQFSEITEKKELVEKYKRRILKNGYETERIEEVWNFYSTGNGESGYKNESYVDFTFMDFGIGIARTLKSQYLLELESNKDFIVQQMNPGYDDQNLDTQILEYAFLMNSSRDPVDYNLQSQYEIPRGLHFLIQIIRRYRGMILARSRKGKVIFDFSKDVKKIAEAVKYVKLDADLPDFEGTLISVVIPAEQNFTELSKGGLTTTQEYKNLSQRKNCYFAVIDLVNKVQSEYRMEFNRVPNITQIYNRLFQQINQILILNSEVPSLLVFDFTGFEISMISYKLLFLFVSSPLVNSISSIAVINFYDDEMLTLVARLIQNKLSNNSLAWTPFKPVPIINSEESIKWIGVLTEEDSVKLSELLTFEQHHISKSDLTNPQFYEGHHLNFDVYGNVRSTIMTASEILNFSNDEQ